MVVKQDNSSTTITMIHGNLLDEKAQRLLGKTEGEGEEERGAQCIMGSPFAVYAYSSITRP